MTTIYANGNGAFDDPYNCNQKQDFSQTAANAAEEMFRDDEPSQAQQKADRDFLNNFIHYMKSGKLKEDILGQSRTYNVPPKMIAKNFFERVLGIISDIGGIVINTACNALDAIIDGVATILHGAVNIIHNIASAIGRILTLNQTATA